jgi:aspartate 1-decarboxylase
MLRTMCRAKITPATVTAAHLWYDGSITVDEDLMEAAGLLPGEQVHVLNLNNGERLVTYAIAGERGSGVICLNGPAARSGLVGDKVTVLSYGQVTEQEARALAMTVVRVDEQNRIAS